MAAAAQAGMSAADVLPASGAVPDTAIGVNPVRRLAGLLHPRP